MGEASTHKDEGTRKLLQRRHSHHIQLRPSAVRSTLHSIPAGSNIEGRGAAVDKQSPPQEGRQFRRARTVEAVTPSQVAKQIFKANTLRQALEIAEYFLKHLLIRYSEFL
jgi:hypothetical protein